ncbi:rab3 GTPase-activating protein catalytic subunit [Aplysia californica]|uniref:Rab3 GTPase-activating protein catalytic subunit n=1 Tax=Aplysia californica TaxID=6500 RepID=A0ABM0JHP2_APLCA|nr:rab3 GTPase-activating protein catalytic subunit [Aplysia californica]
MSLSGEDMDNPPRRTSSKDSAIVDDEADVFEITDFTTASEWERFIARLEEILHEWKLVNHEPRPPAMKNQYANGTWAEKTEEVIFADFRFMFSYLYLTTTETSSQEISKSKREDQEEVDEEHKTPTVYLDIMNFDNDFPSRAHYLCRWYGLQEFFTLIPVSEKQVIDSESRAKLLLSSASVAFGNSNCSIPVFIQLQQKWRKLFTGTSLVRGGSIEFEMSHLKRLPPQYCHLAGLLDVFKSKLGCVYISMPTVSVAVRFTYKLQDWIESAWPQMPPDFSSFCDGEVGYGDIDFLPFGACTDPISELHLSCTWPCLSEDMIVENSMYSDLDPLQAPQWTVRLQMTEDPQCLLGVFLRDFLKLCERHESTDEVLKKVIGDGDAEKDKAASDISNALHKLTEPVPSLSSIPSISNVMSSASARIKFKPEDAPIPDSLLDKILYFLFPDAKIPRSSTDQKMNKNKQSSSTSTSSLSSPVSEHESDLGEVKANGEKMAELNAELAKQLKSAPVDSLTQRLGLALCKVNHSFGGLLGVAHLWQEFILEMRFRWENKHFLSDIEKGAPNMGSCLLHQKLQMLNCCIECKVKRESVGYGYGPDSVNIHDQSFDSSYDDRDSSARASKVASIVSSSDDDEEFFDADDDEVAKASAQGEKNSEGKTNKGAESGQTDMKGSTEPSEESQGRDSVVSADGQFQDSITHRPVGRLVPMKNVFLLATGEQLYIPVTQEPSPMTEDMLEEHAEVLAKLGTSAEGSQIRARMQSACLVSDMESFKAANPGCILEDFVRWYSPRDYVVDDDVEAEEEVEMEQEQQSAGSDTPATGERKGSVSSPAKRGRLSQRMQIPGNMWVEAWQSAKAVSARRQKRLFDDTKEAEKVLHYLASMKPAEVVLHLMPCVIHAAIIKLVEEAINTCVPNSKSMIDTLISRAAKVTRNFPLDKKKYAELLRLIELAETVTARTTSLRSKFTSDHLASPEQEGKEEEIESFVNNLLTQSEVAVKGGACGPAGAIIHKMFITAQKSNNMILDDEEQDGEGGAAPTPTPTILTLGEDRRNRRKNSNLSLPSPSSESKSTALSDFPAPCAREYILRAMVPRPAPYSKVLPQRMYCLLMESDNRIAGAFTSDTTFQ